MTVVPSAVPTPAPPPTAVESVTKSPLPEPRKLPASSETLPPLVLPPEIPVAPSGVIPPVAPNTSRSSPLSGGVKVQVFTALGTPASRELRKVGFFNHTDRDLDLVIEGRAVKLPRKSYLHAQLPPAFQWGHSANPMEKAAVPNDAAGLDVVFRE